jgi:hypothetical protein
MAKKKELEQDGQSELATSQHAPLAAAPDYITEGRDGFENLETTDLVFPRAVLMQALSPAVQDTEEYKAGDIVNSISMELIAARKTTRIIVPLKFWHEWIQWNPRSKGGGIAERSIDPRGPLADDCRKNIKIQDGDKEVRKVTEYLVFLVQPIDLQQMPDPSTMFCICCAKTNFKHGRRLLTLARMRGNKPLYAGAYAFTSATETNKKIGADFWVYNFSNAGWAPKEIFEELKAQYESLKDRTVTSAEPTVGESDEGVEEGAQKAGI